MGWAGAGLSGGRGDEKKDGLGGSEGGREQGERGPGKGGAGGKGRGGERGRDS